MAEIQHLEHAPIKEALIDIRAVATTSYEDIGLAHQQFAEQYPKVENIQKSEIGWKINPQEQTSSVEQQNKNVGYKFTSQDEKYIAQFRTDGFTFSRLEPYETWEAMRDEAKRLWQIYLEVAKPEAITRVAVRYINALRIPLPLNDFKEYLTAPPEVPEGLPQGVSGFLSRIGLKEPTIHADCIFTQALEEGNQEEITVVLDIDAFMLSTFDANELHFWEKIEQLRNFKNQVFFKSITDKTIGLCQ
jgi:uncharacterized protein (TIGR04255 family)